MFKNLSIKIPPLSSLFAKTHTFEYRTWRMKCVIGENSNTYFIERPVVIFGKLFFVPSGVWTDTVVRAWDYIDMAIAKKD